MEAFNMISGVAAPLPISNIDTDMIIPKQYLKTVKRTGLGKNLFDEMRFDIDGKEIADFVLNKDDYREAKILIAHENFGCGSSREHAPWSIVDFGIRSIIAPSFADIFYNNCFKNGILPVQLPRENIDKLMEFAELGKNSTIVVDLETQKVTASNGLVYEFEVDEFRKHCLLNGLDDISLTLEKNDKIDSFEEKQKSSMPWLYKAS